jgi:hypothetical protein
MAKPVLITEFTPVRGRSRTSLIHAFSHGEAHRTVCGRKAAGWIVVPAITGIKILDLLTCKRCKGGCK